MDATKYIVEDRITLDNFLCSYEVDEDGHERYIIRESYDDSDDKKYTNYT